ncbi:hypothetical protein BH20ACT23_BH20ACT23_14530 [soil metagenome]
MTDSIKLRADSLEWREIEGQIVVLDLDGSTYLAVNRVGAVLWPDLVRGSGREDLVDRLTEVFDVTPAVARQDLDSFLATLADQGLLQK